MIKSHDSHMTSTNFEQQVLLWTEGPNLVGDVIGNDVDVPAIRVLWSRQGHPPRYHTNLHTNVDTNDKLDGGDLDTCVPYLTSFSPGILLASLISPSSLTTNSVAASCVCVCVYVCVCVRVCACVVYT